MKLDETEAFVGIVVGAAWADGREDHAERRRIRESFIRYPDLADLPDRRIEALFGRALLALEGEGSRGFLESCAKALPPRRRLEAFRIGVDILTVDRTFARSERDYLVALRDVLGIPSDEAMRVIEDAFARNMT
ncbi:MAG: tellurite resistance TerB family protein [Methanobacteriota archaeon]